MTFTFIFCCLSHIFLIRNTCFSCMRKINNIPCSKNLVKVSKIWAKSRRSACFLVIVFAGFVCIFQIPLYVSFRFLVLVFICLRVFGFPSASIVFFIRIHMLCLLVRLQLFIVVFPHVYQHSHLLSIPTVSFCFLYFAFSRHTRFCIRIIFTCFIDIISCIISCIHIFKNSCLVTSW